MSVSVIFGFFKNVLSKVIALHPLCLVSLIQSLKQRAEFSLSSSFSQLEALMDLRQRCHQATEVYSLRIVKQKWKIEKLAKVVFFLHSFFQNDYKLENKSERVGMLRSSPYQQITAGLSCHYRVFNIPVCMYCIAFHLSAVCLQLTYKTSFRGKGLFWPCCYVVAAHRWRHICKRSKNHSILILWQMINSAYL